jgi:hypothetical protein
MCGFLILFLYYVLGKRKPPTPPKPPLLGHLAGPALVIHGDSSKERLAACLFYPFTGKHTIMSTKERWT